MVFIIINIDFVINVELYSKEKLIIVDNVMFV